MKLHCRLLGSWLLAVVLCLGGCTKKEPSSTWIDLKKVTPGPVIHPELSPEQVARITQLQKTFAEVDSMSLAKWIDDFSRDQNPDHEIAIWEGMAGPYRKFLRTHVLTLQGKKEAFQVVMLRSGSSATETMSHLKLEVLTTAQAQEILDTYEMKAEPIQVYSK